MSEKPEDQLDQDPAPTKESDANRVTDEEAKRASGSSQPTSQKESEQN